MKILLVSHVSVAHGAGGSLVELVIGLKRRGHVPQVILPEPGALSERLQQEGIEFIEHACPWWVVPSGTSLRARQWYLRKIFHTTRTLIPVIRRLRPDIVHTNSAVISSSALAARIVGVPHIWHLHEHVVEHFGYYFLLGRWGSLSLMGLWSHALVAISNSVARAYTVATTKRRMHVVYNGVGLPVDYVGQDDLSLVQEQHARDGAFVLALAGTLHPGKGQDQAIRALAELQRRGIHCQLKLIGADAVGFRQELEKLASQLNVSPSVVFTGHLPNPLDELADADVVLMCSRCEGFGRVTVEAMLLRRPIVAADTCGTVELIENESTGLLYNWGDPLNLADKIQQIVTNPTLGAQLGNAARGSALSRFTVEQYVNSMIGVYENILCRN